MLQEFLTLHRAELIERCKSKAAFRAAPHSDHRGAPPNGIPLILDQLIETLCAEVTAAPPEAQVEGQRSPEKARRLRTNEAASQHGTELLRNGFPVEEIVYGYGDLCQAVMDLAVERNATIRSHEFRTLNGCLDQAIADALISYSSRPDIPPDADDKIDGPEKRLAFLAHELRNHLQTATIALAAMRSGNVGSNGATAGVLDRSMAGMNELISRSLADAQAMAPTRQRVVTVADFIGEIQLAASLEAKASGCAFVIEPINASLEIRVDRELLRPALANLLKNAFKFTRSNTRVVLRAFAAGDRVVIEVEDSCGGLPAGDVEEMFRPFTQKGHDKSGVGLGLPICRRSVEANGGTLGVRDVPGSGCVFAIELPRHRSAKMSRGNATRPAAIGTVSVEEKMNRQTCGFGQATSSVG